MKFWHNLSIAKKLYLIAGIMVFLVILQLFAIRFAMNALSAVRAYGGGEGLWSKAQKNAIFSLQRYGLTRDEKDYEEFLNYLKIPEGDHLARLELEKPVPNMPIVREGFLNGHIHSDDIEPMIDLILRFKNDKYAARAIAIWREGDLLIEELRQTGGQFHRLMKSRISPLEEMNAALSKIRVINDNLTELENEFSDVVGLGSRKLEKIILILLFSEVFLTGGVGFTLTFITSRSILRRLREAGAAAFRVGEGNFSQLIEIESNDEIGSLAKAINELSDTIQGSTERLEKKVKERTIELERLVQENSKLYQEARSAVQARDEFLSIATHELRTPLTSFRLQSQMTKLIIKGYVEKSQLSENQKLNRLLELCDQQIERMVYLVEELLDVSRIRSGKLNFHFEEVDISELVLKVCERFEQTLKAAGCSVNLNIGLGIKIWCDSNRVDQVIVNLLSNAAKYASGQPIDVYLEQRNDHVVLVIRDYGPGIPKENHELIFERFERGAIGSSTNGLGLGLYIVRNIIREHKGIIQVESKVGYGASFIVQLPIGTARHANLGTRIEVNQSEPVEV